MLKTPGWDAHTQLFLKGAVAYYIAVFGLVERYGEADRLSSEVVAQDPSDANVDTRGCVLAMMGAGTLGVPRRHWDMTFAGNALGYEFPGTAYLMMGIMGISGMAAIVGGIMYLLITVGSVFLGKKIATPDFTYVAATDGVAPKPALQPAFGTSGHGASIGMAGFVAPGTFVLALVFLGWYPTPLDRISGVGEILRGVLTQA